MSTATIPVKDALELASENYKEYSADGALCYPDGWSEFIKTLMEY